MTRKLTLHCFASVKGGVGKTTLSVALAKILTAQKRLCVVIDADMTGTSLADGLNLCAPKIPLYPDGSLDLDTPVRDHFYSLPETRELRRARNLKTRAQKTELSGLPPAYLNDALLYRIPDPGTDCQVAAMCWQEEGHAPGEPWVRYLPSSPLVQDVALAVGWLYQEQHFEWIRRLAWIFHALAGQLSELTDVIVDLPPGLFAFSHAFISFLAQVASGKPMPDGYPDLRSYLELGVNLKLVTSQDRQDLAAALEAYSGKLKPHIPTARLLLNRRTEGLSSIRQAVGETLGPVAQTAFESSLDPVDELRHSLGRLFVDGVLSLQESEQRALSQVLLPRGE